MDFSDGLEPEVLDTFYDFWKPLICDEDGMFNIEQMLRELHDYHTCIVEVPKVYMHITNHLLSKPNYIASEVIGVHDEQCWFKRDQIEMAARIRRALNAAADLFGAEPLLVEVSEIISDYVHDGEMDEWIECHTPSGG